MDDQCVVCGEYVITAKSYVTIQREGRFRLFGGDVCYHCDQVLEAMCSQMTVSTMVRRRARQLRLLVPAPA